MNFFKKLFGTTNEQSFNIPTDVTNTDPERTIFDFFQIDLKNIPDESFIVGEIGETPKGDSVQNFRKSLNYKECGIFDTIEIKVIGGEKKNVFFKSFNPDRINYDALKKLIDELYLIHGNDGENKGNFNNKDKSDYMDKEFNGMMFGRFWVDLKKYSYPIRIHRDDNEVCLSIFILDK
jgi:hypothetical protein